MYAQLKKVTVNHKTSEELFGRAQIVTYKRVKPATNEWNEMIVDLSVIELANLLHHTNASMWTFSSLTYSDIA